MPIAAIGLNCGKIAFTRNEAGWIGIQASNGPYIFMVKQE
jgi:hypothetical protein